MKVMNTRLSCWNEGDDFYPLPLISYRDLQLGLYRIAFRCQPFSLLQMKRMLKAEEEGGMNTNSFLVMGQICYRALQNSVSRKERLVN